MEKIETKRWDDSAIGRPEVYGYNAYFEVDGKRYYADISSRVSPIETMIFPCTKKGKIDFRHELYVAYHDETSSDNLLYDIEQFKRELAGHEA